ncbi:MAG: SAM-dependent chlorinase/fluorinase [Chlorobi bacterium]|nr:SAM-dependent chlorinase/fluorinase [Chlorobiota bacterium]
MQIITLTTDWQTQDFYIGAVKGMIYASCPDTTVVDLAHQIPPFNLRHAAYIIRNAYRHFPPGTIHIISVLSHSNTSSHAPLLVINNNHFFILSDSGLVSLMFPDTPGAVYKVKKHKKDSTFPVLDDYIPLAAALITGEKPEKLGELTDTYLEVTPVRAAIEESVITGSVIHIDSYRNAITNIQKKLFERIGKKRSFLIFPGSNHYQITRISKGYHEIDPGDIFAVFNSLDLLEIGIYQGNAAELLGLNIHSAIRVKFKD